MQISAKCVVLYIDLQFCIQKKKKINLYKTKKLAAQYLVSISSFDNRYCSMWSTASRAYLKEIQNLKVKYTLWPSYIRQYICIDKQQALYCLLIFS